MVESLYCIRIELNLIPLHVVYILVFWFGRRRSLSVIQDIDCVAVAQAEHGVLPYNQRKYQEDDNSESMEVDANGSSENGNKVSIENEGEEDDNDDDELKMEAHEQFGAPKSRIGEWASCVQLCSASDGEVMCTCEMETNEAAITCCLVDFLSTSSEETLLVVGTAKDVCFNPQSHNGGMLRVYRPTSSRNLELVHATPTEGIPGALHPFHGRLLAGIGKTLRLFDFGKKRMLRKAENSQFSSMIRSIESAGDRIYVGDARDSFFFAKYRKEDNQLYLFADDQQPRYITATAHIDYDTVACGDKFGNISIMRLPKEVSDEVEDDPTAGKGIETASSMNGAPNKASAEVNFYVGETVTSLGKVQMELGGNEVLLYSTNMGTLGALLPFTSRDDLDFCSHLEMHMRQEKPPLSGRDHLSFRSHYFPVRNAVDGDLCEQYAMLDAETQRNVAEQLERASAGDVHRKLEEMRSKIA
jgi:splicing factor 3B subunit 3